MGQLKGRCANAVRELDIRPPGWQTDTLQDVADFIFRRRCEYEPSAYCLSTADELEATRQWALGRPDVQKRHAGKVAGWEDFASDTPTSWEYALNMSERKRLLEFRNTYPECNWDLGQSSKKMI